MRNLMIGKRTMPSAVAAAVLAFLLPFTAAQANHGSDRKLDAEPETGSREINSEYTITATIQNSDGEENPPTFDTGAINIDFENEGGVNDPDGGASLGTPDAQCVIPAGQSSCSHTYTGTKVGGDTWRVWIDHDGLNGNQGGNTEADTDESRNEDASSGGNPGTGGTNCNGVPVQEPDCTDVVQVTWTNTQAPSVPTTLDCDDSNGNDRERERNPHAAGPQSNETYTCEIKDQFGNPAQDSDPDTGGNQAVVVNLEVENEVNDPDDPDSQSHGSPDYTCSSTTGTCSITVTQGEAEQGTAELCFWVGSGAQGANLCAGEEVGPPGEDVGDNLADRVQLTWEQRMAEGLDLENEKETHALEENRVVTATVYDQFGDPFQGNTQVNLEFFKGSPTDGTDADSDGNSPDTVDASCTTVNDSTCTFEHSQATAAGRDLICGWIGDDPAMKGSSNNASGTCNEEGRIDEDDAEDEADPPADEHDGVDLVETTWLSENPATRLECRPEWSRSIATSEYELTCKATDDEGKDVPNTEVDVEFIGANDGDGKSFESPDASCTTGANGECEVTHGPGNATSSNGDTYYGAWIDADYDNGVSEIDANEGRRESKKPGSTAEPDNTDKVQHKWARARRTVTLHPRRNEVERGEKVGFFGDIDANIGACEAGQKVKLKAKKRGEQRFTKAHRSATTDGNGNFTFKPIRIWKNTKFRAITSKNGACEWERSSTRRVRTA